MRQLPLDGCHAATITESIRDLVVCWVATFCQPAQTTSSIQMQKRQVPTHVFWLHPCMPKDNLGVGAGAVCGRCRGRSGDASRADLELFDRRLAAAEAGAAAGQRSAVVPQTQTYIVTVYWHVFRWDALYSAAGLRFMRCCAGHDGRWPAKCPCIQLQGDA